MGKPAVISDDLTGAMDSGARMAKRGVRVEVVIEESYIRQAAYSSDAVVVDTESRNITAEAAYEIVGKSLDTIAKAGLQPVYKKIDSTLRGNIGKEMEAVLQSGCAPMMACVPALPLNGRTTKAGCQYLDGRLLMESDLAGDPFAPLRSSFIPEIIARQTNMRVGMVELHELRRGESHAAEMLDRLHAEGFKIAVMDSETDRDLEIAAGALRKSRLNILPCGSAGLFSALFGRAEERRAAPFSPPDAVGGPVLVISGSPAKMSKVQIKAAEKSGVKVFRLDNAKALAADGTWEAEVEQAGRQVIECLETGEDAVLDGAGNGKAEIAAAFKENPHLLKEQSKKIQDALSEVFYGAACKAGLSGAVIFGGDTAVNVCRKLHAKGLRVLGEAEPYVPFGTFLGVGCGMPVITKAGGFGTENIILNAIRFLKGVG